MSGGAKVVSHYIKEVTPGVTPSSPANGAWKTMRLTGNTLSPTPGTQVSDEITDSRLSQGSVVTGLTIGGDLTGEMSFGTFDDWLEAAFYGNWTNDVLTVGAARHTFSVQKGFTDVNTYHLFKGVHAATAALDVPEEGKIVLTIGAQALDYEDDTSSFVSQPAAATDTPFMSSLAVGDIEADGVSLAGSACVSAMTINIDNTVQLQRCLGSGKLGPGAIIETEAAITGTVTLAWSAKAYSIWKEQISRTTFQLEFPIVDSLGNKYIFDFPAIEVDGELPSGGKRDIIQVTLNWTVAKQSPTITRVPATAVTSVTITPDTASVDVGDTTQLSATVAPGGASQAVMWHSSDLNVATVNSEGLVTGVGAGTATITAFSAADNTKSDTAAITVTL